MKRNSQAGQTLVLAAVGLTVLLLAAGLAIDMGYLRYEKRRMQTAADAAALAGAGQLPYVASGTYSGPVLDAAHAAAASNGFSSEPDEPNGATVTAAAPTSGPHASDSSYVQVVITQKIPTFFVRIAGISSETVSARAVAYAGNGPGCMFALSNADDAIRVGYSYHTIVAGLNCGIVDNGGLEVESGLGPSHSVDVGSVVAVSYNQGGQVTPAPIPGVQAVNPLAYLDASPPSPPPPCSGQSKLYQPNVFVYPCGLAIDTGGPGNTINLSPGLYTVGQDSSGNGLTISGSGGSVIGNGVTFYVDGPNAAVNINSGVDETTGNYGATVQLQAPNGASSQGIPGVVLFQSDSDNAAATVQLAGFPPGPQPDSYLWGALYLPAANLTLVGMGLDNNNPSFDKCSSTPRLTEVVANQLVFHENLNFSVDDCNGTKGFESGDLSPKTASTGGVVDPIGENGVLVE